MEAAGDEVTYHLPARPLGPLRLIGLLPLAFGALWIGGIATNIFWPALQQALHHSGKFEYFLSAFSLCFMAVGCAPAALGLAMLFGRSRIRWRDGRLATSEVVGPFARTKKMPRNAVRKLLVVGAFSSGASGSPRTGPLGSLAALAAEFDGTPRRMLAVGYPEPWLEAIARDLSSRMGLGAAAVEVKELGQTAPADAIIQKPSSSPVTVQTHPGGVTLEIPSPGLMKGSGGLFFFAIVWLLFNTAFIAAILFGKAKSPQDLVPMILIISAFTMVGIGMLLGAINLGKRRFTFTAGPGELIAIKSGPFGTKRQEFRRSDIETIKSASTNIRVNHRPLWALQVELTGGKAVSIAQRLDPDEVAWMAAELRRAMGMQSFAEQAPQQGQFAASPLFTQSSRIKRTTNPVGIVLSILFVIVALAITRPFGAIFSRSTSSGHPNHSLSAVKPTVPLNTAAGDAGTAFTSLGPHQSFGTTAWGVGVLAHAEWFLAENAGELKEIQIAIAPPPGRTSTATVFLARDNNGHPGQVLESFSFSVNPKNEIESSEPILLESVNHPVLERNSKYWLGARSPFGWRWYFNNQKILHESARETGDGKWASAGDYATLGAFSIRVATNFSAPTTEANSTNQ